MIKRRLFAFFLLFLTACDELKTPSQGLSRGENTLNRAIYSAHIQLDPHFVKVSADGAPVRDLFVGLLAFDPTGKTIPAVAKEWFSEDHKNWLFVLDENARWSNGEAVIASDFVKSWQRLADPKNASPLAPYLVYMELENAKAILNGELAPEQLGVVALNDQTLQIQLHRANPRLPDMLAHTALLPSYQGQKPDATHLISNGAYQLEQAERPHIRLSALEPETPFQQVHYYLITTAQDPAEFDLVQNPRLESHSLGVKLPRLCSYFYEFNFRDPHLQQKALRQAIRAMLSPPEISRGLGIPNHFVIPKTLMTMPPRQPSPINIEPLLREMGISPSNPMRLNIVYDEQDLHQKVALRISNGLSQSDLFRISLQEVNFAQLLAKRDKGDFQLIRGGWCADYADPLQFLAPFHSKSPDNKSAYANPQVDSWLEQLQEKTLSFAERESLMLRIAHQLEQDVAVITLFQPQYLIIRSPDIVGIDSRNSSETIYSKDLTRKPLKKEKQ
ncbi:ATPase [Pasteurellaceae bacterium Macca]|nr:ATPase [Pasteurellaceae bacterium Macca]